MYLYLNIYLFLSLSSQCLSLLSPSPTNSFQFHRARRVTRTTTTLCTRCRSGQPAPRSPHRLTPSAQGTRLRYKLIRLVLLSFIDFFLQTVLNIKSMKVLHIYFCIDFWHRISKSIDVNPCNVYLAVKINQFCRPAMQTLPGTLLRSTPSRPVNSSTLSTGNTYSTG